MSRILEAATYFEVVMDNIRSFYKVKRLLKSRQEILDYCIDQGLEIPCITLIRSFIIAHNTEIELLRGEWL